MSFSHDNKLELRSFRRLKSYIATFSRSHLCAIPPTLVGRLFKDYAELRLEEDNVAVLCRVCNLQIGDKSIKDW